MSLGTFVLGSTIRLPLQITEGGVSVTDATNVKVVSVLRPDRTNDDSFPKDMVSAGDSLGVYFFDYLPQFVGNYIIVYNFDIESVTFTAMDSFYMASPQIQAAPRATPVSSPNFFAASVSSSSSTGAKSVSSSNPSAVAVSSEDPYAKGL